MKVLVTGGGGFLGRSLVTRLLKRGDAVRVLCRGDYPELATWGAEVRRGDVANSSTFNQAAEGCDALMHIAAKVGAWGAYDSFYETNVRGSENAIRACRTQGIRRLVYTSTPSVVHGGGDLEGANESLPYAEHYEAFYPKTKAIAERLILAANGESLSTVALRPHLMWGPGDTQLLPRFAERYRAGKLRLCSGRPKLVDTLYIDNAVDAHLLALDALSPESACAGRPYFISNGEPLPIDEVVNGVLGTIDLGPVKKKIHPFVAWGAGAVAESVFSLCGIKKEPPITRFVAHQLSTAHWFDIGAAKKDLAYEPRINFVEGLQLLRAWHQEREAEIRRIPKPSAS